jgi:hypothetical protein
VKDWRKGALELERKLEVALKLIKMRKGSPQGMSDQNRKEFNTVLDCFPLSSTHENVMTSLLCFLFRSSDPSVPRLLF